MKKKIESNIAEIVITTLFITFLMSSCGSSYQCPSYASNEVVTGTGCDYTEGMDENDEQGRPNLVFINY